MRRETSRDFPAVSSASSGTLGAYAGKARQGVSPANPPEPGLLYAIQSIQGGPVKVGWTSSEQTLATRLSTLQTGNPYRLRVIWKRPGSQRDEHWLHWHHREHRLSGEWFDAVGEVAEFFGAIPQTHPLAELFDEAYEAGWHRGYDDANATYKENADPKRAKRIEEFEAAQREWILTGSEWARKRMYPKRKKAA